MITIDTSTPQLKLTQKWIDGYVAVDVAEVDAAHSKHYRHQTLPKSIGLPEETREEYVQRLAGWLPLFTQFEVRIQFARQLPPVSQVDIRHT